MLDAASGDDAPFEEILVWKFSRFTRKHEHAVAFKSMLRRSGVRVISITEHADDSPTGKLMEAIIESVDEFYSENLAQEVTRGMREAASRGYWVSTYAPYGYKKVRIKDGAKERPKLELDPPADAVVRRIFDMTLAGRSVLDIVRTLNDEGIPTRNGGRWLKNTDHVPSFPIDTKRCATLGEPQCLHEAGRGWNSQDWPCRVDSVVSHSRTNIGMTTGSCERAAQSSMWC